VVLFLTVSFLVIMFITYDLTLRAHSTGACDYWKLDTDAISFLFGISNCLNK